MKLRFDSSLTGFSEAPAQLKDILPDGAMLVTESSPDLLRPPVDRTMVIERGEIFEAAGCVRAEPALE